jgi:hypothetical protein
MALREICDQCGVPIPENAPKTFDIVVEKGTDSKPARKVHLAVVHRLPQENGPCHVCPACVVSNLTNVIAQLSPKPPAKK